MQSLCLKVHQCELLMMDTGQSRSDAGELWIIGLPFFRLLANGGAARTDTCERFGLNLKPPMARGHRSDSSGREPRAAVPDKGWH